MRPHVELIQESDLCWHDAELVRGEGDATATGVYAEAFNQDPEFYSFTRSLQAYQQSFNGGGDMLLIQPDSEFFRYLKSSKGTVAE